MDEVGSLFTGSRFLIAKNPRITLPIVSPEKIVMSEHFQKKTSSTTVCVHMSEFPKRSNFFKRIKDCHGVMVQALSYIQFKT